MTVTEGMDVERVRSIATQLMDLGSRVEDVRQEGQTRVDVLDDVWAGPDLEHFQRSWRATVPRLTHAGQAMRDYGQRLDDQAEDQDDASASIGGRAPGAPTPPVPLPLPPLPPGRTGQGQSLLDRIWDALDRVTQPVRDLVTGVLDGITGVFNNLAVKFSMIAADLVDAFREISPKFKAWLAATGGVISRFVAKWAPKLVPLGRSLLPVLGIGAKFLKALPYVGAGVALWEMKGVFSDAWNGRANPHEIWNKVILGGGSSVAAFFPPYGTLVSVGLTLEQLRHEHMPKLDGWLAEQTGISEDVIRIGRVGLMAPMNPLVLADLLPDTDFDLPGPSPSEIASGTWDTIKDVATNPIPLPSLPNPLPWP
ncbi:WXG100 family type VII secretion target [Janibacter melonis]|uniref:WXG100 family type VII secretion target n=1 Tax=Janibacter melonis TaxID=262209 RepID=UPI00174EBD32|nr:hypothetical protein [Janibacter melonis]